MNTHAIYFFDGNMELITSEEHERVVQAITNKDSNIIIHGKLINTKNISRTGYHEGSAEMIRQKMANERMLLSREEQERQDDLRYKQACRLTSQTAVSQKAISEAKKNTSLASHIKNPYLAQPVDNHGTTTT
jgi:hypothetical protein